MEFILKNTNSMRAKLFSRGATLAELHVPDADGQLADVVLGFDDEAGYASDANQHFGCVTGRYANRIARGQFTLDGTDYQLAINNGPNHLHGGTQRSLDKVTWQGEPFEDPTGQGVRFTYVSPDGEENFPGKLSTTVTYTLTPDSTLRIEYSATTDRATPVNLTNHSYFNLAGHGNSNVMDHQVRIDADRYTVVDDEAIPTGELRSLDGSPLDFRVLQPLSKSVDDLTGPDAGGYDHNYVVNHWDATPRLVAEVVDPASGRRMQVITDQPGVQLYIGNGLHGQAGKQGKTYPKRSAVCLETQHFPDSPNHAEFPTTILRPGENYRHVCEYRFDQAPSSQA